MTICLIVKGTDHQRSAATRLFVERAKSGLIHEAGNFVDFTEKVLELYEIEILRTTLGENGKLFIENEFYWEKTSKKLIEMYSNL